MNAFQEDFFANLNAIYHTGGHFYMPTGTDWRRQNILFEQNKFYYITNGCCKITILDKIYEGKPGCWFFIPANTPHGYYNDSSVPFGLYSVHFSLYPKMDLAKELSLGFMVKAEENSAAEQIFTRFAGICDSVLLCDKIETKACLLNLLREYILLSGKGNVSVSGKNSDGLDKVLSYINENLNQHIENQFLAGLCHLHLTHFVRFFKEKVGQTPQRYITHKRLEAAKRLLEQTQLSITEISESVGFYDTSHFSRSFKQLYDISPLHYRSYVSTKYKQELERTKHFQELIHPKQK
ncbi:MAG: helix-turn-helix domain-containing protein [Clostridia bacterium]|nr:helix-turn-helix domain-containing protein [Clostridia bacterium]